MSTVRAATLHEVGHSTASNTMLKNLEADRARVAEIDAHILGIEPADLESIAELRAEQTVAQQRLDSYTYPVLTLPNEITSEIFIHFLPVYPICPPISGSLSPTCFTEICHKWREVALATPALWRAIGFSQSDSYSRESQEGLRRIYSAWLNRSGSCPLSIDINEVQTAVRMPEVISAFDRHRKRWEYLKLRLFQCSEHSLLRIQGSMPMLRHLELQISGGTVFKLHGLAMPQLRTVVLNAASSVILPWAQLTSLVFCWAQPNDCLRILQQTPSLVHCTMHVTATSRIIDPALNDITLPSLESFVLVPKGFFRIEPLTNLLAILTVPALLRLEIWEEWLGPKPMDSLASFVLTSGCTKLREVHIAGTRRFGVVSDDDYRAAFPSIASFSFEYRNDSSDNSAG
ncbi:hypothetical protein K438DRAFT_1836483 [Mycena galopus ATCC 62051]|nr:hypothetical protein K438DRAFT_1836483 [Mycena galopus ATCC 62051]